MNVRVRHLEEAESVFFTEIEFDQLDQLIVFVKNSGGFLFEGNLYEFGSYQLVIDGGESYAELLLGKS
jgi:hypothetical protein